MMMIIIIIIKTGEGEGNENILQGDINGIVKSWNFHKRFIKDIVIPYRMAVEGRCDSLNELVKLYNMGNRFIQQFTKLKSIKETFG